MINYYSYLKYFFIFLIFLNLLRYEKSYEYTTHPLNIIIDSANLNIDNILHNKILIYLKDSVKILSKIINCIDEPKYEITQEIIRKKCKRKLKISNMKIYNSDLVILPIFKKFSNNYDSSKKFQVLICGFNFSQKIKPNIVLFLINKYLNLDPFESTNEKKYLLKLEILRYLFDGLGLNFIYRAKMKQARNNFFETPLYLIKDSFAYKSLIKLYKLRNIPIPKREINELGMFYDPYWSNDYIIKDFLNQDIYIEYDLTETSLNLLNDLNYYSINKCDMFYDNKGKCHLIDQKCITKEEYDNEYYLQYGIHNSKIFCYLSNKNNLLNKKCGNKYGFLLNEVIDYSPLIKKEINNSINLGNYNIPELLNYNEIELKLYVPSEKCHYQIPRTIYFRKDFKTNFYNLNDILLTEENRKYFITYAIYEDMYFLKEFIIIAKFNGLIRSFLDYGNHNLFIYTLNEEFLKENGKNLKLNKFQKFFNFVGSTIFSEKNSLYKAYKNQKKIFGKEYYYMSETYSYPEEEDFINKKFSNYKPDINNLWLIKPKNKDSEDSIHFFKSLENENESFIITNYISNPHLINGKKYTIRFFVLVSGLKPLRIYIYKEGIVNFAKEDFSLNLSKLNNKYIHLTNNKIKNEFNHKIKNKEEGKKLTLTKYLSYLKENDIEYLSLIEKINDIIIKTIISCFEHLLSKLDKYNLNDRNFFNLFGFDILINKEYEPILLDVENRPDMHIYDKIDKNIKQNIFIDTLNIIGIIPFTHDENQEPLDEIFSYSDPVEEAVDFAFCELTRPQGHFELIFPLKNNIDKYKKFIIFKSNY